MDRTLNNQGYSKYLNSRTKRGFDIVMCIVLFFPAVAAIAFLGLLLLVKEGMPILFIQQRTGKNGKVFQMPKFRTLDVRANPNMPSPKGDDNPLITNAGKLIRKHRLDELPQLFSVIAGQMSLVGPRPELPHIVATYESVHKKRILAKPGITGLWQIMGNHKVAIHQNIKYDLYYLRKASLWLDMKILALTIAFVLKPK
ncbi:sugar transferase [Planctomycetota bacterium]